ncbi:MAG: hypothetical protein Q7W55_09375 [Pseudohongiella sp.]|nr:hypothetical protein [Pseudohongiella sp.]MDO9520935.1 hypothetical protein [Pseudohongiella sp.]
MNIHAFKRHSVALLAVASLVASSGAAAQSNQRLSLFEDVENGATGPEQVASANMGAPINNSIAFVLIGTSQIGDKHRARLRNPAGETVTVDLSAQGSTPVPGYPGFEISRINGRELVVQHPSSSPCMGSQEQGVSCTASHESRLQLATAAPVLRQEAPAQNADQANDNQSGSNTDGNAPENPFAAALRAARERGEQVDPAVMRAEGARFRPRRIDPADVPPGSQLIRTPFGDRIVTQ